MRKTDNYVEYSSSTVILIFIGLGLQNETILLFAFGLENTSDVKRLSSKHVPAADLL